jgi:CDP-glucose 4,6-dehydratase
MENVVKAFGGIYAGKHALVTGHTGFKGGWLSLWLNSLGARVSGVSLPPAAEPNLFSLFPGDVFHHSRYADIRESGAVAAAIAESQPDIVFHLAAQPIVGISYREPLDTLTTNAIGTAMVLEAVRSAGIPTAVVVVTSDKCYRNDNTGRAFVEDDPLGGHDVYSMSKAAAELVTASWHASFFSKDERLGPVASARAGNVIGGGDYAEDRILPDAVRAYLSGQSLVLRNPAATRPWQHVLESAAGYLALGQKLLASPDRSTLLSYNFGPDSESERTVGELMDAWETAWPGAIRVEASAQTAYAEAARLRLDHGKATRELGWRPVWDFAETVAQTTRWYRERHENKADDAAMLAFTRGQIETYFKEGARNGLPWARE